MKIAQSLRKTLTTVKLDRCGRLSNKSIQFLIRKLKYLDELSLMFCAQLTDDCLFPDDIKVINTLLDPLQPPETLEADQIEEGENEEEVLNDPNDLVRVLRAAETNRRKKFKTEVPLRPLPIKSLYLGGNLNMTEASVSFFVARTPKLKTLSIPPS
jgi:hypothetical protein